MNSSTSISALLLAAGKGERMGGVKQLLSLGGRRMIEAALQNLQASLVDEIIVVLGFAVDEIRPLVEGKIRSCFSMTEVDLPGSNPVMLDTNAVKDDDDYVINGHKWYTSSADGARFAIVMAVTDEEASLIADDRSSSWSLMARRRSSISALDAMELMIASSAWMGTGWQRTGGSSVSSSSLFRH